MSWQTPWPWSQASWALVCTSVAPGMYSTRSRTQAAMAAAVSSGPAPGSAPGPPRPARASTVVRGVAARYSAASPASARARRSSQASGSGGAGAALVSTIACDRTVSSLCGAWMSKELTTVPQ